MEAYRINIQGLSNTLHHFEFDLGKEFFGKYGTDLVAEGSLHAKVTLDKRETLIEAYFYIEGTVKLTCDRSLELFDYPLSTEQRIIFKYGQEEKEISEEVYIITHHTEQLELGQLMYEFIGLAIPMKKLHPKFQEQEQEGIMYTSGDTAAPEETDPRWEILKKLNKN
ncbi:MAG: DUF177 domain-containing protein [Cyclobacteriaceae bacterium]|nr:DUF177 domain-containing protein [Cyclobacteriaceae bacterium]